MTIVEPSPIACTLTPGAYKDRLAWIAALNKDALRKLRAPRSRIGIELRAGSARACARDGPQRTGMLRIPWLRASRGRKRNPPHRHGTRNGPRSCGRLVRAVCRQRARAIVMRVCDFGLRREDPFEGAAGFESRRRHGHDAVDRCGCLRRVLRLAVCPAGDGPRQYRILVGVVRQTACVGHHPRHPLGRGCMGLDRVADAPHAAQAGHINALHDGRGVSVVDDRRAMAAA